MRGGNGWGEMLRPPIINYQEWNRIGFIELRAISEPVKEEIIGLGPGEKNCLKYANCKSLCQYLILESSDNDTMFFTPQLRQFHGELSWVFVCYDIQLLSHRV